MIEAAIGELAAAIRELAAALRPVAQDEPTGPHCPKCGSPKAGPPMVTAGGTEQQCLDCDTIYAA